MRQYLFKVLIEPIDCLEESQTGNQGQQFNLLYKNKKRHKGSRISITENLLAKRTKVLQKAREEHEFKNVWMED